MAVGQPVAPQPFGGGEPPSREALLAAAIRWPRPGRLDLELDSMRGIGPKLAGLAAEAGAVTIRDLLWRVPGAYGEPPERRLLGDLEPGATSTVSVTIVSARRVRVRRRGLSVVEARVSDRSGERKAVWFNRHWVLDQLRPGRRMILEGRLEKKGFVISSHQAIEEAPPDRGGANGPGPPGLEGQSPRPRHSGGSELGPARWRRWAWQARAMADEAGEALPAELLLARSMPGAAAALREAHFPETVERSAQAIRRLAYEELLLHQTVLAGKRAEGRRAAPDAPKLDRDRAASDLWLAGLPFTLTSDQLGAIDQIDRDLRRTEPMRRLLMGEVGSGKTVVALWAMLRAVESGRQAALMAPTEVLVDQHAMSVGRLLRGTGVKLGVLTGSSDAGQRRAVLETLAVGDPSIVIGTHALIEDPVVFGRLAVCIVDEEHRFGVRQRSVLETKAPSGSGAHLLHLSATPIPRTLSLTSYGDLDLTALRTLPSGRLPVRTEVVRDSGRERERVFELVREQLDRGRQAFVVCPLVEESEKIEARAAEAEAARLREGPFAGYEVGLIHGRMNAEQKEIAMRAFESAGTDVLVATTVIEVGIDVPNATAIVVEGAERFGLSQLHQLRGRVGRGAHGGCCWLMNGSRNPIAGRRLDAVASESDGFRLAEIDLEMRGEGEVTGTRQHGLPRFRVARLPRDAELLEAARDDLDRLLAEPGGLEGPALDLMRDAAGRYFDPAGASR